MNDLNVCKCKCHTEGGRHAKTCCRPCPKCGLNISAVGTRLQEHMKRHEDACNGYENKED